MNQPDSPGGAATAGMTGTRLYLAIAAISLGTMLTIIDGAIATVALPTIARDLRVDNSSAVLVVTVYQLVLVMALLPFSALGDRIGLKQLYQAGQIVFTIATLLCFFAHSLGFLLVVRALQAAGAAAALSVMAAMIRRIYPARHLGRGLGLNNVVASVSGALAPTAGGLILAVAPWPWVFAAAAPFAILSLGARPMGAAGGGAASGRLQSGRGDAQHGDVRPGDRRTGGAGARQFAGRIGRGGGDWPDLRRGAGAARTRRGRADPAGRPAGAAGAGAVGRGRVHRLLRIATADPVAAVPVAARLRPEPQRGWRDAGAVAADDDDRGAARRHLVRSLSRRGCWAGSA